METTDEMILRILRETHHDSMATERLSDIAKRISDEILISKIVPGLLYVQEQEKEGYVCFNNRTQSYIGIDFNTGGYPFDAKNFGDIHFFTPYAGRTDKDNADHYASMFQANTTNVDFDLVVRHVVLKKSIGVVQKPRMS